MRRSSLVAGIAILVSGCASTQPELVYIDVDRAMASERAPELGGPSVPRPPAATSAVMVAQPGLPPTRAADRTLERLKAARELIAENRGRSIAAMSSMLKRIYAQQAEDIIATRSRESQPRRADIFDAAFAELRALFEQYGEERGPLLAQLTVRARTKHIELADQPIPDTPDLIRKRHLVQANEIRAKIRMLDEGYDAKADRLLADALQTISAQIKALEAQAQQDRAAAEAKAVHEAESKARKTETSLDVQLGQVVPESFPAVPSRRVLVPGSAAFPEPPTDTSKPIFGSLVERRRLVDQLIDIWIRTTGRRRTLDPKSAHDATDEFLQWRSAHKVGP